MAQGAPRHHFLDALRAAAMMLGVVYHVGIFFQARVPLVAVGMWGLNAFRMALFFAIAGFFAQMLYRRLGARGFARQRLTRIGVPFAVACVAFLPLVMRPGSIAGIALPLPALHPSLAALFQGEAGPVRMADGLTLQHLWFLQYLLLYYATALVVAGPLRRMAGRLASARLAGAGEALIASPWKPLLLAVPTAALLAGVGELAVNGEHAHLLPPPAIFLYYGFFFTVGWLFFGLRHRIPDLAHHRHVYALAAVVLLAVVAPVHPWSPIHTESAVWHAVAFYLAALFGWLTIFAMSGIFLVHLNGARPAVRYIADASYWIYLVHLPLVGMMNHLVQRSALPWPIQFAFVFGVVFALGCVSYQSLVRYTAVGAVLNGRRYRSERPAPAAPSAVRPVPLRGLRTQIS
jgi:peptidoglycan/LPS O-acetylase OafA/YrhL